MWFNFALTTIEHARPGDDEALADLHAKAFARGWDASDFARYLVDENCHCVVARRASPWGSGGLVGFALFRQTLEEAELLSIAVAKNRQSQGIGRRLLETGLRALYSNGARLVFLEVAEEHPVAVQLYKQAGFQTLSRREAYYRHSDGSKAAALVMKLDLR